MGLEAVELILRVEEAFGITLPDSEASRIVTIGDMYQLILSRLRQNRSTRCLTARAFHRFRQALVSEADLPRSSVHPDTQLDRVVPTSRRRRLWPRLARRLGLKLPKLRRPVWLMAGLTVAVLLWIGLGNLAMRVWHFPSARWFYGITAATIALAVVATRPLATSLRGCNSVGDIAKFLVHNNFGALAAEVTTVNEKEAWESLLNLVSDELGVPATELGTETKFVEDLNVG
jgi:hypothetical protein